MLLNKKNWHRNLNMKKEDESVQNSELALLKGKEMVLNAFTREQFSMSSSD